MAIRLPQAYREIELDLRNQVAHSLERGKVDLYIYTEAIDNASAVNLNLPLLKEYKAQIERMSEELNIPLPVDWYATLLRMPDAIKTDINGTDVDESELKAVIEAVEKAMEALIEFRTQEGARLQAFFTDKIANIQALLGEVDGYEAERVAKIKGRIQESLNKLESVDYDQNRFEQEMIFYIEKLDITEEKIRLQNHLNYFLSTMEAGHGQGKKLGFISQEMGREINTLGSKSNHAELQKVVVRMKDELEQIKEQVLNVM